jgi:hypothetical protein
LKLAANDRFVPLSDIAAPPLASFLTLALALHIRAEASANFLEKYSLRTHSFQSSTFHDPQTLADFAVKPNDFANSWRRQTCSVSTCDPEHAALTSLTIVLSEIVPKLDFASHQLKSSIIRGSRVTSSWRASDP